MEQGESSICGGRDDLLTRCLVASLDRGRSCKVDHFNEHDLSNGVDREADALHCDIFERGSRHRFTHPPANISCVTIL